MPKSSLEPIPLYGGMRISPPRSEKQNVFVFAVIANPQILFHRGKNAENLEVRFRLIFLSLMTVLSNLKILRHGVLCIPPVVHMLH